MASSSRAAKAASLNSPATSLATRQTFAKTVTADNRDFPKSALQALAETYFDHINADDWQHHSQALFAGMFAPLPAALQKFRQQPIVRLDAVASGERRLQCLTVVCTDRPFLVDSLTNCAHRHGLELELLVYPVLTLTRDTAHKIHTIAPLAARRSVAPVDKTVTVSVTQILIRTPEAMWSAKTVIADIQDVLGDVAAAVDDWRDMRQKIQTVVAELQQSQHADRAETIEFLRWLDNDHFTFLGYRTYTYPKPGVHGHIRLVPDTGLGVIRADERRVFGDLRERDADAPELVQFWQAPDLITFAKSSTFSTVHRAVPMDVVSVKRVDGKGQVIGEHRFVGLFTSLSYTRNPRDIPFLRRKIDWVLEQAGYSPAGHKTKILIDVLTSFPRDELLQLTQQELLPITIGIARIQEKLRTALFLRRDKFGRYYSALIYTPREGFSSDLRETFGQILQQTLGGTIRNFYTQISDQPLARIHFVIDVPVTALPPRDQSALEETLAYAARSWRDRLQELLHQTHGEENLRQLWPQLLHGFSQQYQNSRTPAQAVTDIDAAMDIIKGVAVTADTNIRLDGHSVTIYRRQQQLALSDMLPALENMGLRVLHETALPLTITPPGGENVNFWVHALAVRRKDQADDSLTPILAPLTETLAGLWQGRIEDDGFNRLVTALGFSPRSVMVFRAYAQYLQQIGFSVSAATIQRALIAYPAITQLLWQLFEAQFDPARADAVRAAKLQADLLMRLDGITQVDDDRILRRYVNVILATLRTNFYHPAIKPYLAFKFDCAQIIDMPKPVLWREIFISHPDFEATHLRGGKVARGGIRWSDRRDDFRTEVLGLVKAQMVKNTVIVPVGSKGGFVLKRPPADPKAYASHGVECYKNMLRGMLDITDNWLNGKIIPAPHTVRRDGDDPYLVVAADKGTAKFSDHANAISAEYGFWLGDAFASGGSAGYDHKELAITSRGGWVAVERHCREAGLAIDQNPFTAIGIGDMAGDVFGNGMLRSKNLRLLAAFNHRHIFIDPNPDPAKSFKERQRLFANPQLSWADYDPKSLSAGGAVYDRAQKKITLSIEAQQALGTERADFTPAELMQAVLRTPADLLWLGGIGTFVKSTTENHLDVGDRANDALRIDGRELRVKIVGEGANLGFTQRGRIEYALSGGRINTDAIDNSGGVDTSDHEVNIKILLGSVERAKKLTRPARNKLLRQMSDTVCDLVLRDNYEQTMILSLLQAEAIGRTDDYAQLLRMLEKNVKLNRKLEFLPSDQELADRARAQQTITRPELAVILAYAKMGLYEALIASPLPDDAALQADLLAYFPGVLVKNYTPFIHKHPLRREIIATVLTNQLINRLGLLLPYQLAELAGVDLAQVARAFVLMRDIIGFEKIWQDICALDGSTPSATQTHMALALHRFAERSLLWCLRHVPQDEPLTAALGRYSKSVQAVQADLWPLLTDADRAILSGKIKTYLTAGVPKKLAEAVVGCRMLGGVGGIVQIAAKQKLPPAAVAAVYYQLGEIFALDWMRRVCAKLPRGTVWQGRASSSLQDDLLTLQARLTKDVVKAHGVKKDAVVAWLAPRQAGLTRIHNLLAEMRAAPMIEPAMVTVAIAKIRGLLS